MVWGPPGPLRLTERPDLALPGPGWLKLKPRMTGICGSDLSLVRGRLSPAQSPFHSFPAVIGHEVLADVEDAHDPADGRLIGQRVVVDPFVSCYTRASPPCDACRQGQTQRCLRHGDQDAIGPATLVGYTRTLPGGMSTQMIVHRSQVYSVPDDIPDERAVLTEPYAIAVHAVLRKVPPPGSKVLVLGLGSVGLFTVLALQLHAPDSEVHAVARHAVQADLARRLGAYRAYSGKAADPGRVAEEATGAISHRPILGPNVYSGGFDAAFDCAGTEASLRTALRLLRPGGTLTLVGTPGVVHTDVSFVWADEISVVGTLGYGREQDGRHTFISALEDLRRPEAAKAQALLTHCFPLAAYSSAFAALLTSGPNRPVKAAIDLRQTESQRQDRAPER